MNEYIKKYIDQGFSIFPCNVRKEPVTPNGFYNATTDINILEKQFYRKDFLIGLPTGNVNGIVVIDFDQGKKIPQTDDIDTRTVPELYEEVINNYGPLPETFQVETPSGGRHLYYQLPENTQIKSGSRFIDKYLPIDIRGDGGYVIAPDDKSYCVYDDVDNKGINDLKSRCAPLPGWIENHQKQKFENQNNTIDNVLPESEIKEIRSALSYLSSDDRDNWISIGLALKSTNSPSAYGLWNEWSQTSDKYDAGDMEKRWAGLKPNDKTIASLFYEAKKYGWISTYQMVQSPATPLPADIKKTQKQFEKKPFPKDLLNPDGLVGEIAEYILQRSIMPQPVFALSAALCAVGALAGRKVQTETGIRTNIYCLNVGNSGSGKEAPRKAIKDLFYYAGCPEMATVAELASDSAIITEMQKCNSQIFLLDEIGRFLETTKTGPAYISNIITVLLKMYSSADQVYFGKSYADGDKKQTIKQPNLCLLGTTVPDTLYKGLTYESATDGFLSRMLIFETDNNRPRKERGKNLLAKPDINLINKVKELMTKPINFYPEGDIDSALTPRPQIIKMNENAYNMLLNFENYIYDLRDELEKQNKIETIYNRVCQMAEQIALIIATGRNIDNPLITEYEMSYGISLSEFLSDQMHYIVENHIAKNEHEQEVKRILNIIRQAGCLSLSAISRKTQNLQGHVRNDVIETLKQSNQIQEYIDGEGVYTTRMFTAL